MSGMSELRLDWCSYEAAKFAVNNWHYSERMPIGKTRKVGVWENGDFIGVVIFSRGASPHLGDEFGLDQTEVCELTRIALDKHDNEVSRIGSIALKMLKNSNPGMKLVFSYADPYQDHSGTIYQAMNWYYVGASGRKQVFKKPNGDIIHNRNAYGNFTAEQRKRGEWIDRPAKHKYLYPFVDGIEKTVQKMSKPYP